jgi:hypothetical protein
MGDVSEKNEYAVNDVYKVHVFDETGTVKNIFVFCAKTRSEADIAELFSDVELSLHKTNEVVYHFSEFTIHPDDSIRIVKKKIIQELGKERLAYEEIYMFGFTKVTVNMKNIYQKVSENETLEITKEKFQQIAININASSSKIANVNLEKEYYTYDDFIDLQSVNDTYVNKPIGMEFHNGYDFTFSANPFHIHSRLTTPYEISPKNQLIAFENHLLLNYGKLDSNNIFVCDVKTLYNYAGKVGISHEYITELYFPLLFNKGCRLKNYYF